MAGFKGILHIALLVLSAKLFEEKAFRLRQPPIFGYIIAGIVVGLTVLALFAACRRTHAFYTNSDTDRHLLLFLPDRVGRNGILSIFSVLRMWLFASAAVRFVMPFAVAVPRSIDLGPTPLLAVASVVSISSLGVIAQNPH